MEVVFGGNSRSSIFFIPIAVVFRFDIEVFLYEILPNDAVEGIREKGEEKMLPLHHF